MAGYYIDIIDQELAESAFVIEEASRSSLTIAWNGGDEKDGLAIVGSTLAFNFAHREKVDAKFIKLFTGNEIRFKVELRNQADDAMIWQGFVVPDTYSEPYTNGVTFVGFTAACGLGRLKGKYLPVDFYRDEKSVIAIFCKILSFTSQTMDLVFNPAIENSVQKDWDAIYIDTATFVKSSKRLDAYSILEKLLQDTLCTCYQSSGRWNIEGINKRSVRQVNAKRYNINGGFIGLFSELKLLKEITALVEPTVTMIPPYNMISISHERKPQSLPATIAQEKNEGWAVFSGIVGEIYATDWNGNNGYYCKSVEPNYYNSVKKEWIDPLFIGNSNSDILPFDVTKFINLKNKIYVYKYQKITISATFTIMKYAASMSGVDETDWYNTLLYSFELNADVLFSNRKTSIPPNENLIFSSDGVAKLNFDLIVQEEGLLDIKFWRPAGNITLNNTLGFEITELKISPVNFNEDYEFTDLISDEFTIDKEIELNFADDDTAFSDAFRLSKLKEATINYNTIEIPVKYRTFQNGNHYSVVELDGANLIKDNINTVNHGGVLLENLEVIYNYSENEEMVVKTDFATTASFFVKVYKNNDYLESRKSWLQWTDAIYQVETSRYAQVVANVIRRMFNVASEKIDVVAANAVKWDDLIQFEYIFDKQFVITNCSWNLDSNRTNLTLARSIYRDSGNTGTDPDNIPPIVNAGEDIELTNLQTAATLTATVFDIDGWIDSQVWTKLEGIGGVIEYPNALATSLTGLTGDVYKYQVEVTDNDGAKAVDTISLIRRKDYTPSLSLIGIADDLGFCPKYNFVIDPNVDPSFNLILKGTIVLSMEGAGLLYTFSGFRIIKNGVVVFTRQHTQAGNAIQTIPFTIGYKSTDVIVFELPQRLEMPMPIEGSNIVNIEIIDFINGNGNVIGLPVKAQYITGHF